MSLAKWANLIAHTTGNLKALNDEAARSVTVVDRMPAITAALEQLIADLQKRRELLAADLLSAKTNKKKAALTQQIADLDRQIAEAQKKQQDEDAARKAAHEDEKTSTPAAAPVPPLLALFHSSASAKIDAAVKTITDASAKVTTATDLLEQLRSGGTLADVNIGQKEVIAQLEADPRFGTVIDQAAALLIERLTKGFNITPQRQQEINEALYKKDIGAFDIIKKLTGALGQKFNVAQFEADIKKLVAMQQNLALAAKRAGKATTSGTVGIPPSTSCGADTSLDLLLNAGALR